MSGAELGAKIHSGAEPLAGRLPVARSSAPVTVAPSSAPLTLALSQGSISGILSARGLFERNFQKKDQKVKNSALWSTLPLLQIKGFIICITGKYDIMLYGHIELAIMLNLIGHDPTLFF